MSNRIFIPLFQEEVAPRFDLATEVLHAESDDDGAIVKEKLLILPGPSAERLCHMVMTEHIDTIICGGIDQEVYDYLLWKRISVIDDVIGPGSLVLQRHLAGRLNAGDVVFSEQKRSDRSEPPL